LNGITQASLTQALRRLERNGIVERHVLSTSPVAVEYQITPLGRSLEPLFSAIEKWSCDNLDRVAEARSRFETSSV
jgi:DNA-binding HxlR family transcriptional regulator